MPGITISSIRRIFLVSSLLLGGHALAESTAGDRPCGQRGYMDADGDGVVTRQEFMQGHEKMFERMDQNSDGVLDDSERGAHHRQMKGNMKKEGCRRGMGQGMGRAAE